MELRREAHPNYVFVCRKCGKKSVWYNAKEGRYECLNLECKAFGGNPYEVDAPQNNTSEVKGASKGNHNWRTSPRPLWLKPLIVIVILAAIGIEISVFAKSLVPLWIAIGFSTTFSIERWLSNLTKKYKAIGMLYRLLLNLGILSVVGLLIWSGIGLFSYRSVHSALVGSLILLAEFLLLIWAWRMVAKNSWRKPSMKLTIVGLICLSVAFAFAGVQPMAAYKDRIVSIISPVFNSLFNLF